LNFEYTMETKNTNKEKVNPPVSKTTEDKKEKKEVKKVNYIRTVGRRKTAVARVRLFKDGKGSIIIDDKDWKEVFPTAEQQYVIFSPLKLTSQGEKVDFTIKVVGGGTISQAGAIRHGIARALIALDPEFRPLLKKAGFLTRDPRVKERKKPGLKRARRAPQWKKR